MSNQNQAETPLADRVQSFIEGLARPDLSRVLLDAPTWSRSCSAAVAQAIHRRLGCEVTKQDLRELFALALERESGGREPELCRRIREGTDNSHGGLAAIRALAQLHTWLTTGERPS